MAYINGGRNYKNVGRKLANQPSDPAKVLEIIRLKDEEKLSWRQIADILRVKSRQGPFLLYQRWKEWAATK